MDESFSGFTARGGWVDIVEHGERITRALRDEDVPEERLERWAEWRPKAHERLGEDVEEKTADQGVIPENEVETTVRSSDGDDERADSKSDSTADEPSSSDDTVKTGETLSESVEGTARVADSAGRKALRAAERAVYRTVMRKTAPYYFNADLLTASIERTREDAGPYVFEVTVKDHDLKGRVSERLAEYDAEVERWHVDTEKRTETLEAAEGADPEPEDDANANPDIDTDFNTT